MVSRSSHLNGLIVNNLIYYFMKAIGSVLKWFLYFLLLPVIYFLISLLLSAITVDREAPEKDLDKKVFLSTNGVHLDIIIPKENIDSLLMNGLYHQKSDRYFAFGWGDENFYINTPTWNDLTFSNAFSALFLKSSTLMHVTRYTSRRSDWIEIRLSEDELARLNYYIINSFTVSESGLKILLEHAGYSAKDDFYKANGSYSCIKTCNTWANTAFKESGLKACLWTPFDFSLIGKYR